MKLEAQEIKEQVAAYTVREVAERFGVTTSSVYDWIEQGKLEATSTQGKSIWLVTAASVERYAKQRSEEAQS